jgi:hypothetical protein
MAYIDAEKTLFQIFPLKIKHLPSSEELQFKAMITQFEDQYNAEWNMEQVFGRMDPIRTYRGTQRIITLGWDVVAADLQEAKDNMTKCGKLMSMLYPSYERTGPSGARQEVSAEQFNQILAANIEQGGNASNIYSAPMFQIKFANLISDASKQSDNNSINSGLVGSIDGLVYAPDIEQDFFTEKASSALYPQTLRLSFSLYVAHTHPLGWESTTQKKLRIDSEGGNTFPYFVKNGGEE